MAKFVLEEGEQVIERARARDYSQGMESGGGELILTDRRVVLTDSKNRGWMAMLGLLGALFAGALHETRIVYTIRRDELASATATAKRELEVRSTGKGYAHIKFYARVKDAATWADRIQRWGVGESLETASARVVKR